MPDRTTMKHPPPSHRLGWLIGTAVWLLLASYMLPFTFRGWIPHDDGLLGQLGERALAGELPHIDFDDPYTGGLSWLYAAAFAVLGIQLTTLRIVLLLVTLAVVPFFYGIARRFLAPLPAGMVTFAAFAWSVPNYFAGLPSWYNLLLAIPALWCLLRCRESDRQGVRFRAWLVLFGLLAGLSTLIKISGLFLLAAGLLTVAAWALSPARSVSAPARLSTLRDDDPQPEEDGQTPARGFALAATAGGLLLVALVVLLLQPLMTGARTARALSVLGHFALPIAALAAFLVARAWRLIGPSRRPSVGYLVQVVHDAGWLVAGWLIPVASLVIFYAAHGGLDDLWRGLFVMPRFRYQFAVVAPPPWFALLTVLPLLLLFLPTRLPRRALELIVAGLLALGLLAVLLSSGVPIVHVYVWLPFRALVLLAVMAGLLTLRRRGKVPAGLKAGVRMTAQQSDALFAVLATTSFVALIQIPTPYGIYFYYVAPLVVLALAAVAACTPRASRPALVVLLVFATAFPLMWLNGGHPFSVGYWKPYDASDRLDVARGGIFVPEADARRYEAVVALIDAHAPPGHPIWAAPDCPQIYFLSGRPNPTRTFFDFFAPTYAHADQLLANLDGLGIQVVVLNARQGFSAPIPPEVLARLAEHFPHAQAIEHYTVRWRQGTRPAAAPRPATPLLAPLATSPES